MAKKPDYRLQTLVDIRQRAKDAAEHYMAECMRALKLEQERQQEMEDELERMIAKRKERVREYAEKAMRGEMSAQAAITSNVYIDRLKEQEDNQQEAIEGQKAVVAEKQEELDEARQQVIKATQDLKALEKHKEKWEEEVKKARQAKEEEDMDEIAQTIFI
ncbi:hypothetical protein KAI87_07590, partial [Myxococcota bacterium]|nr:hypothetical protein [Myxococcota bacterium]